MTPLLFPAARSASLLRFRELMTLDNFLIKLYNFLGHSLLSPFECLSRNFILPEFANYVFSYYFFLRNLLYLISLSMEQVSYRTIYIHYSIFPKLFQAEQQGVNGMPLTPCCSVNSILFRTFARVSRAGSRRGRSRQGS